MEDKSYIVYKYTSPSGKSYIGITKNEELRIMAHKYQAENGPMFAWQHAIRKYGFENMEYSVLHRGVTKEEAMLLEIKHIEEFNSFKNGYNSTSGGEECERETNLVVQYDSNGDIVDFHRCISDASLKTGIKTSTISHALNRNAMCHGFKFEKTGIMIRGEYVDDFKLGNNNIDEYEIFEQFYKNAYLIIRRMSSYYSLTQEELKQECAIVFFEHPEIMENYISDNKIEAFKVFGNHFRGSLRDFSSTGILVRNNGDYERQKNSIERANLSYEEEVDVEEDIMNRLELERLKGVYGSEYIDDIIEYYEIGADRYCHKYNISNTNARTRIYRKIQKMRNAEGVI
ncbi:MAG: GIY-YIG nuclease family protein [Paraclostridium sp.]